jgi:hypothetical protein
MSKAGDAPKPGSAPCHACLLRADDRRSLKARSSWRRICDECAEKYVNKPLPVPIERVRFCPDNLGVWGQSREIYQSWDTGLGTVVPARKYILSPVPDGKVAVVLQDAADAQTVDRLVGALAVKPDRPFLLRYCSSIKSFCADNCFGGSRDKSCMAHIKQRMKQQTECNPVMTKPQPRCPSISLVSRPLPPQKAPQSLADAGWLDDFCGIAALGEDDDDGAMNLDDIHDLCQPAEAGDEGTSMVNLGAYLQEGDARPSGRASSSATVSTAHAADSPRASDDSSWMGDDADPDNILSSLLGNDITATSDVWTSSSVDVLGEALSSFPLAGRPQSYKPRPQHGRVTPPLKGVKGPITKHTWSYKNHNTPEKAGKLAQAKSLAGKGGAPGGQGPTQRNKCVWKQHVTW